MKDEMIKEKKDNGIYRGHNASLDILNFSKISIEDVSEDDVKLLDEFLIRSIYDKDYYTRLSVNDRTKCIEFLKYLTDYMNQTDNHHLSATNHQLHYDFDNYDKKIDYDYYRKIDIILTEKIKKGFNEQLDRIEEELS